MKTKVELVDIWAERRNKNELLRGEWDQNTLYACMQMI